MYIGVSEGLDIDRLEQSEEKQTFLPRMETSFPVADRIYGLCFGRGTVLRLAPALRL